MTEPGLIITFSEKNLTALNICLGVIMFGVALTIRKGQFARLLTEKKAVITGIFTQMVLLPMLTVALIALLRPEKHLALGMILVAACPGGNVSNFFSMMARGHVALSVTLTAVSSLLAFVVTPLNFFLWASLFQPLAAEIRSLDISFGDMLLNMALVLLLPLITGMAVAEKLPALAVKIGKPIRVISILLLAGFIGVAFFNNLDAFTGYIDKVLWIVLFHNGLALCAPYLLSKAVGNSEPVNRTVAIETGIQNSGLALVLIFTFFNGNTGMALVAAWWGVWHLLSGFAFAAYFRNRNAIAIT